MFTCEHVLMVPKVFQPLKFDCSIDFTVPAIAEKLQAVVPISSGQMAVRPVTLVASLTNQLQGGQQVKSPGGTTPQQLVAAAQAGHQAAHQLVSAMAAAQNTSQAQANVGVYSQVIHCSEYLTQSYQET